MNAPLSSVRFWVPLVVWSAAVFGLPMSAKPHAPDWLEAAAAVKAEYPNDPPAVVLLDEGVIDVMPDGTLIETKRYAVRILNTAGIKHATAACDYDATSDKIKSIQAWLIRPSGEVVSYGRRAIIDAALWSNALELYGESRARIISGVDDAQPGAVFGFESVVERHYFEGLYSWLFQGSLPVERSRLQINLPPGWSLRPHIFNHPSFEPTVNGQSYVWELTRLHAFKFEPLGPRSHYYSTRMAVDLLPPKNSPRPIALHTFTSWPEISAYFSPYYASAATVDSTISAKAAAVVAGKQSPWEKIDALCCFAQGVNYISISLNLSKGEGMIPRPAAKVLQCNYGDCKDKATFLRALLEAQGITSYPVVLYSGERAAIVDNWTSPDQFNHCILAIKVDDSVHEPAVIVHPVLGRLLIFDPTDQFTPPGYFINPNAGSDALLIAGQQGGLIKLPALPTNDNWIKRQTVATLARDGTLTGSFEDDAAGYPSVRYRQEYRVNPPDRYRELIGTWLHHTLPTAQFSHFEPKDDFDDGRFSLRMDFTAPGYAKPMQTLLLIFKPAAVARFGALTLRERKRTQPMIFEPFAFSDHTEIELPKGFTVDELPAPVTLHEPFGSYSARCTFQDGKVIYERTRKQDAVVIPAADYETVRKFEEKIYRAEQSPVVLRRQGET